jgi:acetyltransferase-like isoleucine patch superfamily enzyme
MWGRKSYPKNIIAATAVIAPSAVLGERIAIGFGAVIYPGTHIHDNTYIGDHAVIGRPAVRPKRQPETNSPVSIGEGSVIGAHAVLYEGVRIGRRVLIGDGAKLRERCSIHDDCIVGSNCTFQRDVIMREGSRVIDLSHITNGVIIGEGAFVSTGVLTMDDDSFAGNNQSGDSHLNPPRIWRGASVGGGAILLPGVNVGEDAVVAAGAVVTKNVADGSTVMGVPAREKHDLGYDGTPGAPSHALLHSAPAFEYPRPE